MSGGSHHETDTDGLARAMCLTSWHGLHLTAWPCPYHRQRAIDTLAVLTGKLVLPPSRATPGGPET